MERSAVHLVVVGRVQGVAFRAYAIDEATRLGLSGWIRNRHDGTVEARVEGTPEAVARDPRVKAVYLGESLDG